MPNPQQRLVNDPKQVEFLRVRRGNPHSQTAAEFNERFGRSLKPHQIAHQCKVWGFQLSQEEERAKKGIVRNANGKMIKGTAAPAHAWKKGRIPSWTVPIGTERRNLGGWIRKINHGPKRAARWQYVHILNWIEAHGPIPLGMKLMCLGDRFDSSTDNYVLVPAGAVVSIINRATDGLAALPPSLRLAVVNAGLAEYQLRQTTKANPKGLPASRDEALSIGSKWYFTGKPCPKGHRAARCTKGMSCVRCNDEYRARKLKEERDAGRKVVARAGGNQ
jgi:hypothetical protein